MGNHRLEGQQFPTPVAFGEEGEPTLLGAMALEHALLAVDPHGQRLMPVDALEMTSRENERGKLQHALKWRATACKDDATRPSTWPRWDDTTPSTSGIRIEINFAQ